MGALESLAAIHTLLVGFLLNVFFGMMAFGRPRHWVEAYLPTPPCGYIGPSR
jgi:hypothetical protein